ncbi:hypothetical protein [Cedecea davisae]|uniref:hypothetical protein n=1 Tax=Cedecea davisae TaxID=158484 RepID=UPI002432A955|nr:hypothetical protein [Cedecea davisae]
MMKIKERLALSARPAKLTLIRTGWFLKCYQQSLFSRVHARVSGYQSYIAHGAFMRLTTLLDSAERQITRWQGWFMRRDAGSGTPHEQ